MNPRLPLIGCSSETDPKQSADYWHSVFSSVWGGLNVEPLYGKAIFGSLYSLKVGDLSFNRIEFKNQQFEKNHNRQQEEEPFFSFTFPEKGSALCQIENGVVQLLPGNTYLLNNGLSAKLRVEQEYSTFNLKIPVSLLEHRLGRNSGIISKTIKKPNAIFHIMQRLIIELLDNYDKNDEQTTNFIINHMLDTVAFFLSTGNVVSNDSIAVRAAQERVLAYIESSFRNPQLTPQLIAAACNCSRSYLYKIFVDSRPIMERVTERRLEFAKHIIMMRSDKPTMTEVAMLSGFSSSSEFSRLFKKKYGMAPSKV